VRLGPPNQTTEREKREARREGVSHDPVRPRWLGLAVALGLLFPRCGDEFRFRGVLGQPIPVRDDASLPLLPVRIDDRPIRWALLDIGSPITVMRLEAPESPREGEATVAVLDTRSVLDEAMEDITRMAFPGASVYDYAWDGTALGTATTVDGVLGGDLLGRFALEMRLGIEEPSITFFDTVAGEDSELSADGWAVFPSAYKGGGRTDAGCEPALRGRRLVVDACVFPADGGPGVDASLAVTTSVVDLTLGEESATRLPSPVARLAIVADSEELLGPCEELARREQSGEGAAAVRADGDFAVETLLDSNLGLVAARAEVANSTPGIDGFLGTAFLEALRVRLDYPGARLLARCEEAPDDAPPTCLTLPRSTGR